MHLKTQEDKEKLLQALWNLFLHEHEHIFDKQLHFSPAAKSFLLSVIEKENPPHHQSLLSALAYKTTHLQCQSCKTFCNQECFHEPKQSKPRTRALPSFYSEMSLEQYFDYNEWEYTYWAGSPLFFQFKYLAELI